MSRQWHDSSAFSQLYCENQQQRGTEHQDLETLWHGQEGSVYFCCIQGRYSQQFNIKIPGCFRHLPQAQECKKCKCVSKIFQGRFSSLKSPGVLCVPRTVLGFRPISLCLAMKCPKGTINMVQVTCQFKHTSQLTPLCWFCRHTEGKSYCAMEAFKGTLWMPRYCVAGSERLHAVTNGTVQTQQCETMRLESYG